MPLTIEEIQFWPLTVEKVRFCPVLHRACIYRVRNGYGFNMWMPTTVTIPPKETVEVDLGIIADIPNGYVAMIDLVYEAAVKFPLIVKTKFVCSGSLKVHVYNHDDTLACVLEEMNVYFKLIIFKALARSDIGAEGPSVEQMINSGASGPSGEQEKVQVAQKEVQTDSGIADKKQRFLDGIYLRMKDAGKDIGAASERRKGILKKIEVEIKNPGKDMGAEAERRKALLDAIRVQLNKDGEEEYLTDEELLCHLKKYLDCKELQAMAEKIWELNDDCPPKEELLRDLKKYKECLQCIDTNHANKKSCKCIQFLDCDDEVPKEQKSADEVQKEQQSADGVQKESSPRKADGVQKESSPRKRKLEKNETGVCVIELGSRVKKPCLEGQKSEVTKGEKSNKNM